MKAPIQCPLFCLSGDNVGDLYVSTHSNDKFIIQVPPFNGTAKLRILGIVSICGFVGIIAFYMLMSYNFVFGALAFFFCEAGGLAAGYILYTKHIRESNRGDFLRLDLREEEIALPRLGRTILKQDVYALFFVHANEEVSRTNYYQELQIITNSGERLAIINAESLRYLGLKLAQLLKCPYYDRNGSECARDREPGTAVR